MTITPADAFEVLCLQAADEGRGSLLFGDSLERVRSTLRPFILGDELPDVYLEFPLIGPGFLDITVLYTNLEPGAHVESETAKGTAPIFDWYIESRQKYDDICFGFELDTKNPDLTAAALHFQPRAHRELVEPFCTLVGEPERAALYLALDDRLSPEWALSFFGMFRGRPGSPLRVCGYLHDDETAACAQDPQRIARIFDRIGFEAYNDTMLAQIAELMGRTPGTIDFQFDIWPDGNLSKTFAIDVQFEIQKPELVRASFTDGPARPVMDLLTSWGIADERWKNGIEATFARAIPIALEDGTFGRFGFTIMPQWVKARWHDTVLQPAKLYHLGNAGPIKKS